MASSPSALPDTGFLTRRPFAHRGLHGGGRVENSRAAFAAAIAAGHGIELDVQIAACGTPIVFHDATLERLTSENGAVADRDAAALGRVRLASTDEGIPTLAEILALVGTAAPLLIEVKATLARATALADGVVRALDGFSGEAAVMSFNPEVCRRLAADAPHIVRGMVVSEQDRGRARAAVTARMIALVARPHFVALDVRDLPSVLSRRMRAEGRPVLTWTVRNATDRAIAAAHADQIIYEQPA